MKKFVLFLSLPLNVYGNEMIFDSRIKSGISPALLNLILFWVLGVLGVVLPIPI